MSDKFEKLLEEAASSQETMKIFAEALAQAEAQLALEPTDILVNGIVRDDQLAARFNIDKTKVTALIEHFLRYRRLNPDILVNGIPSEDVRSVSVNVGRGLGR